MVGDWRLRMAVSWPAAADALLLQLGLLASGCFAAAGRTRCAALLAADSALLLLRRRRWAAALLLLEARCAVAAREGW
jgi:hypothetical protein